MASMPELSALGGFDCDYVDAPPESLTCPICLLPFRDPHVLDCCGAKYCEICIGRVKAAGQPCPLCKQTFVSILDRTKQRKVLSLRVRCSKKNEWCVWIGELRHLEKHEREECGWELVECRYRCGKSVYLRNLSKHEEECSQRSLHMSISSGNGTDVASMIENMGAKLATERERHDQEMAAMRAEFERRLEQQRKDYEEKLDRFMREVKNVIVPQCLAEQMRGLNIGGAPAAASTHCCLPCVFTMTNYSQLKRAGDSWYSPPFYTSPQGYKFYLTVYANGSGGAAGKFVSVFVDIMKGEYDDRLNWAFQGAITFQLVNRKEDSDHIAWTADYSGWAGCGARVFTEERANRRLGKPKFISHLEIEEVSLRRMYLHNDCLTWKLMYMQLH